jgi:hypothetical protein
MQWKARGGDDVVWNMKAAQRDVWQKARDRPTSFIPYTKILKTKGIQQL